VAGSIEDPETHRRYSMKLDMEFALNGGRITVASRKNWYSQELRPAEMLLDCTTARAGERLSAFCTGAP
jgi:hypothetical protein